MLILKYVVIIYILNKNILCRKVKQLKSLLYYSNMYSILYIVLIKVLIILVLVLECIVRGFIAVGILQLYISIAPFNYSHSR